MTATTADVRSRVLRGRPGRVRRARAGRRPRSTGSPPRPAPARNGCTPTSATRSRSSRRSWTPTPPSSTRPSALDPADVAGLRRRRSSTSRPGHPEHLRMLTWARLEGIDYRLARRSSPRAARSTRCEQAQRRRRRRPALAAGGPPRAAVLHRARLGADARSAPEDQASSPPSSGPPPSRRRGGSSRVPAALTLKTQWPGCGSAIRRHCVCRAPAREPVDRLRERGGQRAVRARSRAARASS